MKKPAKPPGRPRKDEAEKHSACFPLLLSPAEVKRHAALAKRLKATRAAVLRDYINNPAGDRLFGIRMLEELQSANATLKSAELDPFTRELALYAIIAAAKAITERYGS